MPLLARWSPSRARHDKLCSSCPNSSSPGLCCQDQVSDNLYNPARLQYRPDATYNAHAFETHSHAEANAFALHLGGICRVDKGLDVEALCRSSFCYAEVET